MLDTSTTDSGGFEEISYVSGFIGTGRNILTNITNFTDISIDAPNGADVFAIGGLVGSNFVQAIDANNITNTSTIDIIRADQVSTVGGYMGSYLRGTAVDVKSNSTITIGAGVTGNYDGIGGYIGQVAGSNVNLVNNLSVANLSVPSIRPTTAAFIGEISTSGGQPNFSDVFYDTDVATAGMSPAGGSGSSMGISGETTASLYLEATYTNWNFVNLWQINSGVNYPEFQ